MKRNGRWRRFDSQRRRAGNRREGGSQIPPARAIGIGTLLGGGSLVGGLLLAAVAAFSARAAGGSSLSAQLGLDANAISEGAPLLLLAFEGLAIRPTEAPGAMIALTPLGGSVALACILAAAGAAARRRSTWHALPIAASVFAIGSYLASFAAGPVGGPPANLLALAAPFVIAIAVMSLGWKLSGRTRRGLTRHGRRLKSPAPSSDLAGSSGPPAPRPGPRPRCARSGHRRAGYSHR